MKCMLPFPGLIPPTSIFSQMVTFVLYLVIFHLRCAGVAQQTPYSSQQLRNKILLRRAI